MQTIKEVIEFADAKDRDTLSELISRLQIQRSRMAVFYKRRQDHTVSTQNISDCIRDTAEIYARSGSLYLWARRKVNQIPPVELSYDQLISAFNNLSIFDDDLEEILTEAGLSRPH
jgi:hypothetical protein